MRKTLAVLLVVLLSSCGGNKPPEGSPKATAREFLDKVLAGDLKGTYAMLTKRQQSETNFDLFTQLMQDPQSRKKISEMGLVFTVNEQFVEGTRAKVYGTTTVGQDAVRFRLPLAQEGGVWMVDSPATQIEVPGNPAHYIDFRLLNRASKFFQHMLNGEAQQMWDMASSKVHNETTPEVFKSNLIGTKSGKTPKEEGFNIIVQIAWSNDEGQGTAGCEVQDPTSSNEKPGVFEANFVLENGEWVADFDRLELKKQDPAPGAQPQQP